MKKTTKRKSKKVAPAQQPRISKKFTKGDLSLIQTCADQYVSHMFGDSEASDYHTWIHYDGDAECIRGNLAIPLHMTSNIWSRIIGRGVINGWCKVTGLPVKGGVRHGCAVTVHLSNIPQYATAIRKAYVDRLREHAGDWWHTRACTQGRKCSSLQHEIDRMMGQLHDKGVDPYPENPNANSYQRSLAKSWEMDTTLATKIQTKVVELVTAIEKFHQLRQRYSDEYHNWKKPSEAKITAALVAQKLAPEE